MPTVRVEVSGDVQGVGFRWFAREAARGLDLAGWVRNRTDGVVEVIVDGEEERVEQFLSRLERGPALARVEQVRRVPVERVADAPLPRPFAVLR